MKKLVDGTLVSSMSYYFLLDWNDKNNKIFIVDKFQKQKLNDLNINEYMQLWLHATITEYNKMRDSNEKLQ